MSVKAMHAPHLERAPLPLLPPPNTRVASPSICSLCQLLHQSLPCLPRPTLLQPISNRLPHPMPPVKSNLTPPNSPTIPPKSSNNLPTKLWLLLLPLKVHLPPLFCWGPMENGLPGRTRRMYTSKPSFSANLFRPT